MPNFYYATVRSWLPHEICAFQSEEYRNLWLAKQDVNTLADPEWFADDDRIALTEGEAEALFGRDELDALRYNPDDYQDDFDPKIWVIY